VLVLTFLPALLKGAASWAQLLVVTIVYVLIVAGALDIFLMWRRTKAQVIAKFGEAPARGSATYAVMRAFQMRRSRLPRPQVERVRPRIFGGLRK
jgi:type II secretory pathway component PulK